MEQSKKKKDYTTQSKKTGQAKDQPIAFSSFGPATANTANQPPSEPSKAELLYKEIKIALHGKVKSGIENKLCDWKMPPCIEKPECDEKENCEQPGGVS